MRHLLKCSVVAGLSLLLLLGVATVSFYLGWIVEGIRSHNLTPGGSSSLVSQMASHYRNAAATVSTGLLLHTNSLVDDAAFVLT